MKICNTPLLLDLISHSICAHHVIPQQLLSANMSCRFVFYCKCCHVYLFTADKINAFICEPCFTVHCCVFVICDYLHGNKVELPADTSQQMKVLTEKMNDGVVYIYVYIVASDNLFV